MRLIIGAMIFVAATMTAPVVLAQSQDSNGVKLSFDQSSSTCIRQIPDAVKTVLYQEIAAIVKNAPLSPEKTIILKNTISALDENEPVVNAERRRAITEVGDSSIPAIAEMLLSQDEKARSNAVLALSYIQPLSNKGVTGTPSDRNVRIMLLRVGILDISSTIRRNSIRYLARIGYANPRNIPEGVIAGIDSAMDDPDSRLKRIAETEKEALTLAAEVAQTRSEDLLSDTTGASEPSQAGAR